MKSPFFQNQRSHWFWGASSNRLNFPLSGFISVFRILRELKIKPPQPPFNKGYSNSCTHGLRTPREEIAFTARPKIKSQCQISSYGQSICCLPHRPKFSDFFDLCLHWVLAHIDNKERIERLSMDAKKGLFSLLFWFTTTYCAYLRSKMQNDLGWPLIIKRQHDIKECTFKIILLSTRHTAPSP